MRCLCTCSSSGLLRPLQPRVLVAPSSLLVVGSRGAAMPNSPRYAKYLDCGADMFFEAVLLHWLSNGRQPNGMLLRLQGFGDGVFGGNFHTHNSLHIPPGLDVVCYSNGRDYARGFRYAMRQAAAGRVVMSVDSTNLLYMRHLHGSDEARMQQLSGADEELDWDTVRVHGEVKTGRGANRVAIVTYGNGVVTSLQVRVTCAVGGGACKCLC